MKIDSGKNAKIEDSVRKVGGFLGACLIHIFWRLSKDCFRWVLGH